MPMKTNREYRAANGFETETGENKLVLRGVPVVFDTPTCLFESNGVKYFEQIARGAFGNWDFSDFIFNYNHGGRVYARNRNGSLEYAVTDSSINITAYLLSDDEGHKQLYRDIQSGLIDKMSFSFSVEEESYNMETHTRTILKIKKLYDVSAVDIPAYNDTSISARNFFEEEHRKEFEVMERARRKKMLIIKSHLF